MTTFKHLQHNMLYMLTVNPCEGLRVVIITIYSAVEVLRKTSYFLIINVLQRSVCYIHVCCVPQNIKLTPFPKIFIIFKEIRKKWYFDISLDFLRPLKVRKIGPKTSGCDFDRVIEYNLEHGSSKNMTSS